MKLKLDDKGNVVVQDGKPVYTHDDGKDIAFDAPAALLKISALNAEAKGHREAKESAEGKLKLFDGIQDAEAARKAVETLKNIDEGKLLTAGKVEEIKAAAKKAAEEQVAAANKSHAEELARTKSERDKLQTDLYNEMIGGSFSRSKFIAEKVAVPPDMLQATFGKAFKVEDGKIIAYDHTGNRIFSRARPGDVATFDEALESLIDAYPHKAHVLKGAGASGGGAAPNNGGKPGQKSVTRAQMESMSSAERMAHVKAGGVFVD